METNRNLVTNDGADRGEVGRSRRRSSPIVGGNGQQSQRVDLVVLILVLAAGSLDVEERGVGDGFLAAGGRQIESLTGVPCAIKIGLYDLAGCIGCPGAGMSSTGHCLLWELEMGESGELSAGFTALN